MAKVLQIRRGTAIENDMFTGMPGELSYDTDHRTLRIHDGKCPGGYTLAMAIDESGRATDFDLATVPDEFWARIIQRNAPAPYTHHTGFPVPVTKSDKIGYIFDVINDALFARVDLVCQSDEAGYNAGDVVNAFGCGEYTSPMVNVINDGRYTYVRLMVGEQDFWTPHKETGVKTPITNANWRLVFHLYC